jgi:hypothetical protein
MMEEGEKMSFLASAGNDEMRAAWRQLKTRADVAPLPALADAQLQAQ